jgi:uridine phosphorylase
VTLPLRPTAPIAPNALLPGDPGRALALAQDLLERPRMCNHHRGLWGYSGRTRDGSELTIQATGIGGSSAAIVLADLARHGVRRAIRLGTCVALDGRARTGALLATEVALADEGASRSFAASDVVHPDPQLHRRLLDVAGTGAAPATVASVDVSLPIPGLNEPSDWQGRNVVAVEMGTATLFALGARLGVAVASGLVVSQAGFGREPLDDDALERASLKLGAAAARAVSG